VSQDQKAAGPDKLRGLSECAKVWGIARKTLNGLLATGELGYVCHGPRGERRIPDSEVYGYIRRNLVRLSRGEAK
jgi:hypothetical protein